MAKCIIIAIFLIVAFNFCECKDPFSLDEFLNGTFVNRGWNGTWVGADKFIYQANTNYYLFDAAKGSKVELIKGKLLEHYKNPTIYLSADQNYALIKYNVRAIFRHSTTAQYALFSSPFTSPSNIKDIAGKQHLQYCAWAGKTSSILYVRDNNIYYLQQPATNVKEVAVTSDGKPGVVYNGVPDWVYEEEVLSSGEAIWVAPNGTTLVYAQFDDTEVPTFSYINYGEPGKDTRKYPEVINVKYPKVGEKNPKFDLFVHDLSKNKRQRVELLQSGELSQNFVLYGVVWNVSDYLVLHMNRVQNSAQLKVCKGVKCAAIENYTEKSGWLDVRLPRFNQNGSMMAEIQVDKGYHQLWLKKGEAASKVATTGKRTVVGVYGVDGNITYFGASVENAHWQQHVYSHDARTGKEQCLTCNFTTPEGNCTYASISFSQDMSHHAKICHGVGPNYVTLEKTANGGTSIVFEDNQNTRKLLSTKTSPTVQNVVINRPGYSITARLLLPPNMDTKKKYPMIVNVYAGPNSNQIKDTFSVGLDKFMVTNKNYIYAYIDGRGSGRRGTELMHQVYQKLGGAEIEDQIIATQELQKMYSYIDGNRTAIWGWSYGGFATAWALVKDTKNVFKCGISVAPVTNFLLYDSIYTERYMGLFDSNVRGYNETDLTQQAEKFRAKKFLLIHGNADDNVHYQQSMLLARALELADVPFLQMSYPEENHSLRGVSSHLYHAITKFWDDNLRTTSTYNGSVCFNTSSVLLIITLLLALINC